MIAVLFSTLPLAAFADQLSETFTPYPGNAGVQLGTGWDSFRGEKTPGSCVIAGQVIDQGEVRNVDYKEITDTSSLMEAFSVSAEAKVSAMGTGGSASASFSKSVKIDNYGLNVAVNIKYCGGCSVFGSDGSSK